MLSVVSFITDSLKTVFEKKNTQKYPISIKNEPLKLRDSGKTKLKLTKNSLIQNFRCFLNFMR